jgi:hypothetical protein
MPTAEGLPPAWDPSAAGFGRQPVQPGTELAGTQLSGVLLVMLLLLLSSLTVAWLK